MWGTEELGMKNILLASILVITSACAPVALLKKESADGGRVHVTGPGSLAPEGMEKAEEVMAKKCPGGYEKLEWGEESSGAHQSMAIGYGNAVSADIPARFVEFKCKPAQAATTPDPRKPASK